MIASHGKRGSEARKGVSDDIEPCNPQGVVMKPWKLAVYILVMAVFGIWLIVESLTWDVSMASAEGRLHWWLWSRLPLYLGLFAGLLVEFVPPFGIRRRDRIGTKVPPRPLRLRFNAPLGSYIVLTFVGAALTARFLPAGGLTAYTVLYWVLIGVTAALLLWFVTTSVRGRIPGPGIKRALAILLLLAGLASGPMAGLWGGGALSVNSPAGSIVAVFLVIPVGLFARWRFSFKEGLHGLAAP